MIRALALLVLVACGGPTVPAEGLSISECLNPEGGADVEVPSEELLLTGLQDGLVVAHRAHALNCGHDTSVRAELIEDEGRIEVTYEDANRDATSCECVYDMAYTLTPLDRGPWIVRVPGGLQAQVEVD